MFHFIMCKYYILILNILTDHIILMKIINVKI